VRVISGSAKGRRLAPVPGAGTRPITDRVKESLFNILGADIEDARLLDLFGGTGSVGIEALSRGAREVVFVERAHKAVETIRKNLQTTQLQERAHVLQMDAFHVLDQADPADPFHYVYVAPPQYQDLWAKVLAKLDARPLITEDGLIIVQIHPKEYRSLNLRRLRLYRERSYGSTSLYLYELATEEDGSEEEAA
jgi:16S rRNA (guanine966-N2)-methyltransferase